tara:strand:+ start:9730 stop:10839 length:1110 start_codon:yes stop_codon:yes gene_type:complete
MLLETAELAAYISGTLAALVYVLDTCYPFCIKKCFPIKLDENGNPITKKNKERDKENNENNKKGKKTLLRSKIKKMMKEDSERIKNKMRNNKSQHINNKNSTFENNTNKKDDNSEMNLNTNETDIFSIQAFELQLGGIKSSINKDKTISRKVNRYNNIQHSRKLNRHRRHSSMFTRNKYRRERDSFKNTRSSSSLHNFKNRNPFSPIKKGNSYDKYFGESDDSKHELTSLFEDNDLIDLNDLNNLNNNNISSKKNQKTNEMGPLPKIVVQPSISSNNNDNNHNNNELLLPDNKDVLYRNINDIKSDNSIYNTFLESNKRESLELNKELINLKQKKKNKSYSYSSIYSTDTDDIEGDTDYIDVFQTSKSL